MVGENFEIYISQMAKNAFKLSTMVGENFEIYLFQKVPRVFPEFSQNRKKFSRFSMSFLKNMNFYRFSLSRRYLVIDDELIFHKQTDWLLSVQKRERYFRIDKEIAHPS